MVEGMDFKRSSKKAWDLLKKLGGGSLNMKVSADVTPNEIASRLMASSKMPINKSTVRINRKLKKAKSALQILLTLLQ